MAKPEREFRISEGLVEDYGEHMDLISDQYGINAASVIN